MCMMTPRNFTEMLTRSQITYTFCGGCCHGYLRAIAGAFSNYVYYKTRFLTNIPWIWRQISHDFDDKYPTGTETNIHWKRRVLRIYTYSIANAMLPMHNAYAPHFLKISSISYPYQCLFGMGREKIDAQLNIIFLPFLKGIHLGKPLLDAWLSLPFAQVNTQFPSVLKSLSHITVTVDPSITFFGWITPWFTTPSQISEKRRGEIRGLSLLANFPHRPILGYAQKARDE